MPTAVSFSGREWNTRPHEPGEPARHTSELSDEAGFTHTRANLWRYEPGARGRRHVHAVYGSPPDFGAEVLPDAL